MSGTTTWAAFVNQPNPSPIVLVEVQAAEWFTGWTLTDGQTYTYQAAVSQSPGVYSFRAISAVSQDGTTDYTEVASVAAVEATPASFFHDTAAGLLYVRSSDLDPDNDPRNNIITGTFWLYYSGGSGVAGREVVFNGHPYLPYLAEDGVPRVSIRLQDPMYGTATVSSGTIGFANNSGAFDILAAKFLWRGREVRILVGGDDLPYTEYQLIHRGRIRGTQWTDDRFMLSMLDETEDLLLNEVTSKITADDITQTYTFTHRIRVKGAAIAGTYWCRTLILTSNLLDGQFAFATEIPSYTPRIIAPYTKAPTAIDSTAATTSQAIGQTAPIIIGTAKAQAGIILAQSNTEAIVKIANGPIHRITGVRDRNGQLLATANITYLTVDLQNAVVHEMYTDPADLVLYFNSYQIDQPKLDPTLRPYSYDVEGIENADDGTLMTNPADVIKHLVNTEAGISTEFESTSFAEAQVRSGLFTMGCRIDQPQKAGESIKYILQAIGGHLRTDSNGEYVLSIWTPSMANPVVELVEATGDFLEPPAMTDDEISVLSTVLVAYGYTSLGSISGVYGTSGVFREMRGLSSQYAVMTVSSPFSDAGSATLAARRIARSRSKPMRFIRVATRMKAAAASILDVVKLTRVRMPLSGAGLTSWYGRIIGVETDLVRFTQRLTLDDGRTMLDRPSQAFLNDGSSFSWGAATTMQRISNGFWTDTDGLVVSLDPTTYRASLYY